MFSPFNVPCTIILAFARRVVAVELNKSLCEACEHNLAQNGITNVHVIACDSAKFTQRILRAKSYTRQDTGEEYNFRVVLVDPPRCGLDTSTRSLIANYDAIVYISCSPESLARDLEQVRIDNTIALLMKLLLTSNKV